MKLWFLAALAAVVLAGCAAPSPAPVVERAPEVPAAAAVKPAPRRPRPDTYTVRQGDTLYSIALDYGLDYRDLASWNAITDPNMIRAGQVLSLKAPQGVQVRPVTVPGSVQAQPLSASSAPAQAQAAGAAPGELVTEPKAIKLPYSEQNLALLRPAAPPAQAPGQAASQAGTPPNGATAPQPSSQTQAASAASQAPKLDWGWPSNGKIIAGFSDPTNKGIDIAGNIGDPVYAAASGIVRYVGTGIPSLGELVVIKHNNDYISAYAHNNTVLVKEGQAVVKGQKIAEIGSTGTDHPMLHFEIRRLGKPVDPLTLLPKRP